MRRHVRRGFGLQDALSRDDRCFDRDLVRCRDIIVSIEEGNVQKHRRNRMDRGSGCRRRGLPEGATPENRASAVILTRIRTPVPSRADQIKDTGISRRASLPEAEEKHDLCAWCSGALEDCFQQ